MPFWTSPLPRLNGLNGLNRVTRLVVHASAINVRYPTNKPSFFATFHRPTVRTPASFPSPKFFFLSNLLSPLPMQKDTMMSVNGVKKEKVVIIGSGNWFVAFRICRPSGRTACRMSKPVLTRLSSSRGSAIARIAGKYLLLRCPLSKEPAVLTHASASIKRATRRKTRANL